MQTLTRKQREYRQRETQILQVASQMLRSDGYLKLTMDRVGQAIEYAKGTVYRHFDNKEDIIVALGVEMFAHEVALFSKAASWQGMSRERFMACGVAVELHHLRYPEHMQIHQICGTPALFEKARTERQQRLRELEDTCMRTIAGICQDAIVAGDLTLESGITAEIVIFGPWATFTGAQVLIDANIPTVEKGIPDVNAALWLNVQKLVDGYGWKPLSTEYDFMGVREQLLQNLFADDVAEIQQRGGTDRLL
jgi:AcrR family transcriptional regulator